MPASILGQLRWFIGTVIVGLLLLWLFPQTMANLSQTLLRFPWQSLGLGVLIVAPLVILIVAIIAIIIGGFAAVPVGLVPGAAYLVLLSLTAPVIAILIGGYLLGSMGSSAQRIVINWKGLVLGTLILALIGLIPFLDVIIGVLVILFGFGAWIMLLSRSYSQARRAQTI